jgi:ankyrin repeat protein
MEKPKEITNTSIEIIANILLGAEQFNPDKLSLPPEDQYEISMLLFTNINANSLNIAAKTVNSLAQVNKKLNELINDPQFCRELIKYLAIKFDCSDFKVAHTLKTQEAKRQCDLQRELYKLEIMESNFVNSETIDEELNKLINQGIDLEFTFTKHPSIILTPLMHFMMTNCPIIVQLLIKHGVNINQKNNVGQTALLIAAWMGLPHMVKILLDAGADPEPDAEEFTPLEAAQLINNQNIINLIQNAIDKKNNK